jgi:hypothetical protein
MKVIWGNNDLKKLTDSVIQHKAQDAFSCIETMVEISQFTINDMQCSVAVADSAQITSQQNKPNIPHPSTSFFHLLFHYQTS